MRQHVYLSTNLWDGLWIIQQPTCDQISRHEPVLYVERHVSLFTILRYPKLWTRLFSWMAGARSRGPLLRVLAPLPLFHLGHQVPWLFRLEWAIQRLWIRAWAGTAPEGGRVLWMDNPMFSCVPGSMGESLSIYHVADEPSAFKESNVPIMERLEADMLARVDMVFAAAESLRDHKAELNPRSYTVWNAIDASVFSHEPPATAFADIEAIAGPRVVFVGVFDEWCDLPLMEAAATRLPHVQFLFIGPVRVDVSLLKAHGNVHFLGRRDRSLIAGILRRAAASLVAFRCIPLTERIVPLKIFEALAAGIMPICTPFSPDLRRLESEGLVRLGANADQFVEQIAQAIARDTSEERRRLSEFGLKQTWADRWCDMSGRIEQHMNSLTAKPQNTPRAAKKGVGR